MKEGSIRKKTSVYGTAGTVPKRKSQAPKSSSVLKCLFQYSKALFGGSPNALLGKRSSKSQINGNEEKSHKRGEVKGKSWQERTRWKNLKYGDSREENHVNDSIFKGETL